MRQDGKGPNRYAKGTRFEHKVRDDLAAMGYVVVRAAGSKGNVKADLVAFHDSYPLMLVQCKTNGQISKAEWDRLYEVAGWYEPRAVAVVAANGPKGSGVTYTRITGERVPYARTQPCVAYDPAPDGPTPPPHSHFMPHEMTSAPPLPTPREPAEQIENGSPDYHG